MDGGTVAVSVLDMVRTWKAGRGCIRADKALTATRLMWPMAVASPHKTQSKRNIYRLGVTIINRFADARRAAGFTQKQAAQELGVRQSTVANWETGCRKPAYTFITAMARLYGCTTDYLLGND